MKYKRLRNIILSLLLICLLIVPSTIYGEEEITATLIQPAVYKANEGDELTFSFEIMLPDKYQEKYESLAVTLRLDEKLDVVNEELVGVELSQEDYLLNHTSTESRNFVNFSLYDVNRLMGAQKFHIDIVAKIKPGYTDVSRFENSYVLSYVDKSGEENYIQKDLVSTPPKQEGKNLDKDFTLTIDPIFNTDSSITGKTEPEAIVRAYRNTTEISSAIAQDDGNFSLQINPQPTDAEIKVEAEKDNRYNSATIKVQEEEDLLVPVQGTEELRDLVDRSEKIDRKGLDEEEALRLEAVETHGRYLLVKNALTTAEVEEGIDNLKAAIQAVRPAYMGGYPDGTFKPKESITRAEVATIFTRISGGTASGFSSFKDVDDNKWYAGSISYMEKSGLINGYRDGTFKPENSITRAEFATIVSKYLKLTNVNGASSFNDVPSKHWAKHSVDLVSANGLMKGRAKGQFAPNEPISRQEVTLVINKAIYREPNEEFIYKYTKNPFSDVEESHWAYTNIMEATGN